MNKEITKLTPEQEALIPEYFDKWLPFIFSCEPINPEVAIASVKAVYELMGYGEPQILVFDSPYAAWQHMIRQKPISFIHRLSIALPTLPPPIKNAILQIV